MSTSPQIKLTAVWALRVLAAVFGLLGLLLLGGGLYLMALGGSWYYAIAGAGLIASAWYVFIGNIRGVWIYLGVFAFTVIWALFESGLKFWALEARIVAPMFLAGAALLSVQLFAPQQGRPADPKPFTVAGAALMAGFVLFIIGMFFPQNVYSRPLPITAGKATAETLAMEGEWLSYGRTIEGARFSPADQINRGNVAELEQAWAARSGDIALGGATGMEDQNTPLFADGFVYHCSPNAIVTALDGVTGETRWRFDPEASGAFWKRCRTLSFFRDPEATATDACAARLIVGTQEAQMIALDAKTGDKCDGFGTAGVVNLNDGMGDPIPGFYVPNTGPMLAGDKILVGGWVGDNYSTGEPSGVVRAFDARTGALVWAFDVGNPDNHGAPAAGDVYTLGTPNVWAPMAFDLDLGLAYLPTGNATPDYFGGLRRPFDDEYNSSVIAVDLATGVERWRFRTVNHDLWDYDLPSQPALIDFPDGAGGTTPAVLQTTKRGQLFVLDRRTGAPLVEVEEKPVPESDGTAIGEYYAPTQPYAVGMPVINGEPLTERQMWGMVPFDQLLCRIAFRKHVYEGDFTPMSVKPTIIYPGNNGGMNWGSATVDPERNILVVADMRMPVSTRLIERKEIPPQDQFQPDPHGELSPQFGLPYGNLIKNFFSPLGVPCLEPPIGTITAVDLGARKIIWQRPAGTMKDVSIGNWQPGVAFYTGMPALGGAITTRGGVTFHSGTQDYYLRAYDTETGKILWEGRLPSGSQSTPMTYVDAKTGKQFVVVTAGGARYNPNDRADWIIAFALPAGN